ncbi:hypothetical protein FD722_20090, partial [Photobacterium damselae subsp. damselae]|uniref:hypothetical protein n=1 Tax=Photobacterium damselae TaxID=38293 RepID=UPI0010FEE5DE
MALPFVAIGGLATFVGSILADLFLKLTTVLGKKAAYLSIFLALFFSLIQIIDATVVVLLNNLSANFNHSSWQSLNVFVPYGLTRCFSVYFS